MQFGAQSAISWPVFMIILTTFLRRPNEPLVLSTLFIVFLVMGLPVATVSTAAFALHRLFFPSSWKPAWLAATVIFGLGMIFGIMEAGLLFSTLGTSAIAASNILTIIAARLTADRLLQRLQNQWPEWASLFRMDPVMDPSAQALDTLLPPIIILVAVIAYFEWFADLIVARPIAAVVLYGAMAAAVPLLVDLFLRRLPFMTPEKASCLPGMRRRNRFWSLVLPSTFWSALVILLLFYVVMMKVDFALSKIAYGLTALSSLSLLAIAWRRTKSDPLPREDVLGSLTSTENPSEI